MNHPYHKRKVKPTTPTPAPGSMPEAEYTYAEPNEKLTAQWRMWLKALRDSYKDRSTLFLTPQQRIALLSEITPISDDGAVLKLGAPNDRTAAFVLGYYATKIEQVTGRIVVVVTG
jgi:uncharacterized protein